MTKVALVTGGTRGIGKATAKKFLEEGYKVAVVSTGKNEEAIKSTLDELEAIGDVVHIGADISKVEESKRVVKEVIDFYGQIDVLANVAGIVGVQEDLDVIDDEVIRSVIDTNLYGTIFLAKEVVPYMKEKKSGTIVNIGSIDGIIANHENIAYHASKGAIRMFTQSLAREVSPYGIRVVSVAPGWVRTEIIKKQVEEKGDQMLVAGGKMHMKGRIVEPEEIAGAVWLLTLPEASAINGTTVMADDGYSAFKGVDQEAK